MVLHNCVQCLNNMKLQFKNLKCMPKEPINNVELENHPVLNMQLYKSNRMQRSHQILMFFFCIQKDAQKVLWLQSATKLITMSTVKALTSWYFFDNFSRDKHPYFMRLRFPMLILTTNTQHKTILWLSAKWYDLFNI